MTPAEKLKEIEDSGDLNKYPDSECGSRLISDMEWLIARVKTLESALREIDSTELLMSMGFDRFDTAKEIARKALEGEE